MRGVAVESMMIFVFEKLRSRLTRDASVNPSMSGMLTSRIARENGRLAFAARLKRAAPDGLEPQIRRAIHLTTGRIPAEDEVRKDVAFIQDMQTKHKLSADDFARVEERVAPWRLNVIHPLRAVRRWLREQQLLEKAPSDQLRRGVLGYEIESESVQQRLMESVVIVAEAAPSASAAASNLAGYLAWARTKPRDADKADLATLLSQVFPPLSREAAQALL